MMLPAALDGRIITNRFPREAYQYRLTVQEFCP